MANKRKKGGGAGRSGGKPASVVALPPARDFGEGLDVDEIDEWGYDHYSTWARGIDLNEQGAIDKYVGNSSKINDYVRKGLELSPTVRMEALNLRNAVDKAKLPEDTMTYRGFSNTRGDTFDVGSQIKDKGFQSTSLSYATAKSFSGNDDSSVILRMRLVKGTRAAYLNATPTRYNRTENELLLPAGATYTVRKRTVEATGRQILDVDYTPGV